MALLDHRKNGLQETTDLPCKHAAQARLGINVEKIEVTASTLAAHRVALLDKVKEIAEDRKHCKDHSWLVR